MYSVRWLDKASDAPDDLWLSAFAPPFEGKWWYETLEKANLDLQFQFMYALVSWQDSPVALAPAFLMNVPIDIVLPAWLVPIIKGLSVLFPSLRYHRTLFMGSPCSDEGRVGMLKGIDTVTLLAFLNQALQEKANVLRAPMRVWKDFSDEYQSAFAPLIKNARLFHMPSFPGTQVALPGYGLPDYLDSLKASRRNKLNKKLKLANAAPLKVEVLQNPSHKQLERIFALFWQTYQKGSTKFERLNRHFFEVISNQPTSHYLLIKRKDSDEIVAFMLCFVLGQQVINKFIGIDYSQPKEWFLYFKLWDAVVNWAYQHSISSIQSGQTGYAPKIELGHRLIPLHNFCYHQNSLLHYLYARIAGRINWASLDRDLAIYLQAYPQDEPKRLS